MPKAAGIVTFVSKIKHPPIYHRSIGKKYSVSKERKSAYAKHENFDFFEVENRLEQKEGEWTFIIESKGAQIFAMTFYLTRNGS